MPSEHHTIDIMASSRRDASTRQLPDLTPDSYQVLSIHFTDTIPKRCRRSNGCDGDESSQAAWRDHVLNEAHRACFSIPITDLLTGLERTFNLLAWLSCSAGHAFEVPCRSQIQNLSYKGNFHTHSCSDKTKLQPRDSRSSSLFTFMREF